MSQKGWSHVSSLLVGSPGPGWGSGASRGARQLSVVMRSPARAGRPDGCETCQWEKSIRTPRIHGYKCQIKSDPDTQELRGGGEEVGLSHSQGCHSKALRTQECKMQFRRLQVQNHSVSRGARLPLQSLGKNASSALPASSGS